MLEGWPGLVARGGKSRSASGAMQVTWPRPAVLRLARREELWEGLAQRLGGVWVKDKAASDSMEPACALMQLNGLIRTAIRLIRGLEIR